MATIFWVSQRSTFFRFCKIWATSDHLSWNKALMKQNSGGIQTCFQGKKGSWICFSAFPRALQMFEAGKNKKTCRKAHFHGWRLVKNQPQKQPSWILGVRFSIAANQQKSTKVPLFMHETNLQSFSYHFLGVVLKGSAYFNHFLSI